MKINLGPKGAAVVGAIGTTLAVVVSDAVLDTNDVLTVLLAALGTLLTGAMTAKAKDKQE